MQGRRRYCWSKWNGPQNSIIFMLNDGVVQLVEEKNDQISNVIFNALKVPTPTLGDIISYKDQNDLIPRTWEFTQEVAQHHFGNKIGLAFILT